MKMKAMGWHHDSADNKISFWAGVAGGVYQYLMNIHLPTNMMSKLLEGAVTAIVCGFAGVLGKELYKVARNAIRAYFRNKNKSK